MPDGDSFLTNLKASLTTASWDCFFGAAFLSVAAAASFFLRPNIYSPFTLQNVLTLPGYTNDLPGS